MTFANLTHSFRSLPKWFGQLGLALSFAAVGLIYSHQVAHANVCDAPPAGVICKSGALAGQ